MTVITILLALFIDYFIAGLTRFRRFDWFISLYHQLVKWFASCRYRNGTLALVGLLSLPLLVVFLLSELAWSYGWYVNVIFSLLVLLYCLEPNDLACQLDTWIDAVERKDTDSASELAGKLLYEYLADDDANDEAVIIKSAFVKAHKNTFAVLFWFLLLGPFGALLYRLADHLCHEVGKTSGDFADSARLLLNILEWPSSRLMVISLALAGNLVEALPGWKKSDHFSFDLNNEVLIQTGLGALQYRLPDTETRREQGAYQIAELKSLLSRMLIIWLVVLGLLTLSGTLG